LLQLRDCWLHWFMVVARCSVCYWGVQGAEASQQLLQQIQRALAQAQAKLHAKASSFREQLQGGEAAAATQKLADMLMANLHR
jgi:predicted ribosome quality control (RQC) complex YloA/Tae2 family protein